MPPESNEPTETTENEKDETPTFVSKDDFEGFTKTVTDTLAGIADKFDNLAAANSSAENEIVEPEETPSGKEMTDRELEMLPRREFEARIIDKVAKEIAEPINKDLGNLRESTEATELGKQVTTAIDSHKDFWDWREDMITLNKRLPSASPEELYQLARTKNPTRATEFDEKYKEKGTDEEDEKNEKKTNFGGLTPTSGYRTEPNQRMTREQANEKAWTETMDGIDQTVFG